MSANSSFNRIVLVVLDSVGIGEMPDAAEYGDAGADTLGMRWARGKYTFRISNEWVWPTSEACLLRELRTRPAYLAKRRRSLAAKIRLLGTGKWEALSPRTRSLLIRMVFHRE